MEYKKKLYSGIQKILYSKLHNLKYKINLYFGLYNSEYKF